MSLLEKLPKIVEQGRKTAEQILDSLETKQKISLLTREFVFPARESVIEDIFTKTKNQNISGAKKINKRLNDAITELVLDEEYLRLQLEQVEPQYHKEFLKTYHQMMAEL